MQGTSGPYKSRNGLIRPGLIRFSGPYSFWDPPHSEGKGKAKENKSKGKATAKRRQSEGKAKAKAKMKQKQSSVFSREFHFHAL